MPPTNPMTKGCFISLAQIVSGYRPLKLHAKTSQLQNGRIRI